jgi:hypothetical protein
MCGEKVGSLWYTCRKQGPHALHCRNVLLLINWLFIENMIFLLGYNLLFEQNKFGDNNSKYKKKYRLDKVR